MPGQTLVNTKYFTSIISDPPDKRKRQAIYLDALKTIPELSIHFGQFLIDQVTCNNCGHTYTTHHEKMTDVNIALHLVTDAIQDRFDVALLFSADSDLVTAINAVHDLVKEKKVICIFPPHRYSNNLIRVADGYKHIDRKSIIRSQFPEVVNKPNGSWIKRPTPWK